MKERLRMCISCRNFFEKRQLVRVVKSQIGKVFVDPTGKQNGRGAYICSAQCLEKCKKHKLLSKALKCNVQDEIYDKLSEAF